MLGTRISWRKSLYNFVESHPWVLSFYIWALFVIQLHCRMSSKLSVLDFQYNLSKKLPLKPAKLSIKDRKASDLMPIFQPNADEMRQVFNKMSNKGKITLKGLQGLLETLGKEDAASEAKSMMLVADLNRDGFIDFGEFMEVHKKGVRTGEIHSAFRMFDQDGDGMISPQEVKAVLERLGERCSLEECRRMVRQVDKNGDGLVDMDEFMAMMISTMKLG